MGFNDINIQVSGPQQPASTYKTKVLKGNLSFALQVTEPNTKYVIKHNFELDGDITIPENCILEFDGGSLKNGTIENVGKIVNQSNNTILYNINFVAPAKQTVWLNWFSDDSVANSIEKASLFGIIDVFGRHILDRTVQIYNDVEIYGGTIDASLLGNTYGIHIESTDKTETIDLSPSIETINKGSNEINVSVDGEYKYMCIKADDWWFNNEGRVPAPAVIRKGRVGEILSIENIESTKVKLIDATICQYTTNIKAEFFNPVNVYIHDCTFVSQGVPEGENGGCMIKIIYGKATIDNCRISGTSQCISLEHCVYSNVVNSIISDFYPWGVVFLDGTYNSSVTNCKIIGGRHGFATLGETAIVKHSLISNNTMSCCAQPCNTHSNAYDTVFDGNLLTDCLTGVNANSPNTIVKNNTISLIDKNGSPGTTYGINFIEAGYINPSALNNVIDSKNNICTAIASADTIEGCITQLNPDYAIVKGNFFYNNSNLGGISIGYKNCPIEYINISNNVMGKLGYGGVNVEAASLCLIIQGNSGFNVSRSNYRFIKVQGANTAGHKMALIKDNILMLGSVLGQISDISSVLAYDNFVTLAGEMAYFILSNVGTINYSNRIEEIDPSSIQTENKITASTELFALDSTTNKPIYKRKTGINKFFDVDGAKAGVNRSGTFLNRPATIDIYVGFKYFSTNSKSPEANEEGVELIHRGSGTWIDSLGRIHYGIQCLIEHVSVSGYGSVQSGESYDAVLIADDGYSLPSTITVKMGSATLASGTDYTYDSSTGAFHVIGWHGSGGIVNHLNILNAV